MTGTLPGVGRPPRRWQVAAVVGLGVVALAGAGIAWGERNGWPFLVQPLERLLTSTLDRRVRLSAADASAVPAGTTRFSLLGGVRVSAPYLEIAAPAWSKAPHQLLAREVTLELRYIDLWRAHRGLPLRVHALRANVLDADIERLADGRASWQFGPAAPAAEPAAHEPPIPLFDRMLVAAATVHYRDVPWGIDLRAEGSLTNGDPAPTLRVKATGHYRELPLKAELISSGLLPWAADETSTAAVTMTVTATIGRATFGFNGHAVDALHLRGLDGRFGIEGPSLAAVGDPFGVTLPTTPPFHAVGRISKQGKTWQADVDETTIGSSQLRGRFSYDTGRSVPLLAGQLSGTRLLLVDLGPAVGTTPKAAASAPAARAPGKVLPDRPFDLKALRAMDGDVRVDIDEVDLHTRWLEPLRPLRGHLTLAAGVLSLSEIDARAGQGRVQGKLALDGRGAEALWTADLRWDGIRLEHWIHQRRADAAPPFVTGALQGVAGLRGRGLSTAQILGDLSGQFHAELLEGTVSHLAVEAAGLDLAQGLGVMMKGDDALPVPCAVADLVAQGGVFRPRAMVLDTADSVIWIDGSVSLAAESIDLRAVVMPKDFSPLAVRTPLQIRGSFDAPAVTLQKGPLARKLGAAVLLALLNPLAALIPFVDPGNAEDAERGAARCRSLMRRAAVAVR